MLTKGSKQRLKEFDKYVKLRRAYLVKLFKTHSKSYKKTGVVHASRRKANNAMHHNILNNLRIPASKYWKKRKGVWECNGCRR